MASLINKARKPKFELHLKIYDLNNVPLVSGVSFIKWHLPHSIHAEHRGRTSKCPIANHRVEYNYGKTVPVRIAIDRNSNLAECPIEFEVLQEFSMVGGGGGGGARDEKITLGTVRLNLSEYVEESEAVLRDGPTGNLRRRSSIGAKDIGHSRKRSSVSALASSFGSIGTNGASANGADEDPSPTSQRPGSSAASDAGTMPDVEDGVVRRYLMQDSKINSTLKIGILLVQVDGERNFVAPPLKTAPVFGGIAGIMAGEPLEGETSSAGNGNVDPLPVLNKSRDTSEMQDMYRRALAASWACQPGEMPADECIEDIFAGGNGFRSQPTSAGGHKHTHSHSHSHSHSRPHLGRHDDSSSSGGGGLGGNPPSAPTTSLPREDSGSASGDEETETDAMGTLRPRDIARLRHHARNLSAISDRSIATTIGGSAGGVGSRGRQGGESMIGSFALSGHQAPSHHRHNSHGSSSAGGHRRDISRDDTGSAGGGGGLRSRSESLASLATTLGSDRGRDGFKRAKEVDEFDERDDLVAWSVPSLGAAGGVVS